jgi:hypothetical protein
MSSVTVAASAASYRREAPRLRVNDLGRLATVARSIAVMMTAVCYSAGVRGSRIGVSYFKIPLSLRAMISFFSLAPFSAGLAPLYVNAGARMMLPMGGHGFLPKQHGILPKQHGFRPSGCAWWTSRT